jgi:EmrB/QacA subfamily drug resistance transporter
VVNAYTLTFGGFLLLGGRLADLLGRRRMFMVGLVLFSLASFAGGIAQSESWLIAARAVQGLGAAIVSPAALSIITTTFAEGPERNRALGVWGAVAGAGGAAGVLLGGILTSGLSWRWVLFVNVPIGILAAALAPRTLVESRTEDGTNSFDVPGAVTVTAGLALLVYAVVDAVNIGWGSTATILRLAGAAVLLVAFLVILLVAFLVIELRQRYPLMPFSIFRLRTLRGANIVGLLIGMSLFSMFFFISLYLQNVMHYSPIKTGISYLPLAVGIILSAGIASQLVNRLGFKPPLIAGLLLIAGGLAWFGQVPGTGGSYVADVLGPSLLAAVGLGFSFVPVTIAAVSGTEPHEAGLASGLINTSQQVGGALGLAILATVANSRTQSLFHAGVHNASVALTKGFDRAFLVGAGFAVVGALLATVLISSRDSRTHVEEARRADAGWRRRGRGRGRTSYTSSPSEPASPPRAPRAGSPRPRGAEPPPSSDAASRLPPLRRRLRALRGDQPQARSGVGPGRLEHDQRSTRWPAVTDPGPDPDAEGVAGPDERGPGVLVALRRAGHGGDEARLVVQFDVGVGDQLGDRMVRDLGFLDPEHLFGAPRHCLYGETRVDHEERLLGFGRHIRRRLQEQPRAAVRAHPGGGRGRVPEGGDPAVSAEPLRLSRGRDVRLDQPQNGFRERLAQAWLGLGCGRGRGHGRE